MFDFKRMLIPCWGAFLAASLSPQCSGVPFGSNASFAAEAFHTTGYQWQKDGTNLVENGHFVGVTNANLTILGAGLTDTGAYSAVANHPAGPVASVSATLFVFKPIGLALTAASPPMPARLVAFNIDGTSFEPERLGKVDFYWSTELDPDFSSWTCSTNSAVLTNGVLQLELPGTGDGSQFWRAVEGP